jgi:hypothetical protein
MVNVGIKRRRAKRDAYGVKVILGKKCDEQLTCEKGGAEMQTPPDNER